MPVDLSRLEGRFVEKEPNTGCWLWTGATAGNGYGKLGLDGRTVYAHRTFYESVVGAIPAGLKVCHRCDTPSCVNPDHLFVATQAANLADARAKGRTRYPRADRTHCPNGHPFGTRRGRDGGRICTPCQVARKQAWRADRRANGLVPS